MFSGIVERMGEVVEIRTDRQNKDFTLRAEMCIRDRIKAGRDCFWASRAAVRHSGRGKPRQTKAGIETRPARAV